MNSLPTTAPFHASAFRYFAVLCLSFRFGFIQKVFFTVACSVCRITTNESRQHKFQTKSHLIRAFSISAAVIQQFHFALYVNYVINARCTCGGKMLSFCRIIEIFHENGLNNRNISIWNVSHNAFIRVAYYDESQVMECSEQETSKDPRQIDSFSQIWHKQSKKNGGEFNCSTLNRINCRVHLHGSDMACVDSSNLIVYSNVYLYEVDLGNHFQSIPTAFRFCCGCKLLLGFFLWRVFVVSDCVVTHINTCFTITIFRVRFFSFIESGSIHTA